MSCMSLRGCLMMHQVKRQSWHPKYKPIPNIRQNAPCVRITVSGGKIADISSVSAELGKSIRKYGDNQGTYPCMNLAPLYRITDESVKRELADLKKHPEKIDTACICKMKTWCTQNNWGDKVQRSSELPWNGHMRRNSGPLQPGIDHFGVCLRRRNILQT